MDFNNVHTKSSKTTLLAIISLIKMEKHFRIKPRRITTNRKKFDNNLWLLFFFFCCFKHVCKTIRNKRFIGINQNRRQMDKNSGQLLL